MGTVPEGLLVTLIVSLSLSAKNMYAKNVLVKVGGCCRRRRCCCCWSMHPGRTLALAAPGAALLHACSSIHVGYYSAAACALCSMGMPFCFQQLV